MRKDFFARLALSNIRKNRKIYYPYILTTIATTAMLYIICSLSGNTGLNSDSLAFSLQLGVFVTTLFSVIFLFYTNSFLMKRRKKEFGLFNILGMEKKHIGLVVLWETVFILIVSLLIGFGFGMLLDKLMLLLLARMLGSIASLTFYVSGYGVMYTSIVLAATFALILLNSLRQIHLAKPIELLQGGQVGEREPKARWFLALIGALALGMGYWISINIIDPVLSILMFFVAVVLVIIGTYLLFTAGSVTVLKLLRKNKRYYYRADHFISLSGMLYRMKQNAVGLANVCILCTMVLVMVFSTVTLWLGIGDMTQGLCPTDFSMEYHTNQPLDKVQALMDNEVQKAGLQKSNSLSYTYLSFSGYKQGDCYLTDRDLPTAVFGEGLTNLFIMPLDSYNQAYGTNEALDGGEILLGSFREAYTEENLRLFDMNFHVKAQLPQAIKNGLVNAMVYDTQFIVVKDWVTFEKIHEKQKEAYGKHASEVRQYYQFDVSGTDEQQLALNKVLKSTRRDALQEVSYFWNCRVEKENALMRLYGGLLFVGLFLGALFIMAMILIIYYKQISEGYDDKERYHIMQKVGLSRSEIKSSIGSQILTVFFLPLLVAGIHVGFSFPSIVRMLSALGMFNVPLMVGCALASFTAFAVLYGIVYILTAKVYYRIVSRE